MYQWKSRAIISNVNNFGKNIKFAYSDTYMIEAGCPRLVQHQLFVHVSAATTLFCNDAFFSDVVKNVPVNKVYLR